MSVTLNPMAVTNAGGLFQLQSDGYVQGFMQPDPAARYALMQGILAASQPNMIPGAAVKLAIPSINPQLGGNISYALTAATIQGFSIGNQAYNGIITPTASVPVQSEKMSVQYVLLGSGARICLGISAGLAATLTASGTESIATQVSWDFQNQQLVPYAPAYTDVTITGAVWANTAGGRTTYTVSTDLTTVLNAGDVINVTGVVSTGATTDGYNGTFVVVSVTSTTIVVTAARAASPGTYSSGGTVLAGGGAISVTFLAINAGNSQQVYLDDDSVYQWNPNGNVALVKI